MLVSQNVRLCLFPNMLDIVDHKIIANILTTKEFSLINWKEMEFNNWKMKKKFDIWNKEEQITILLKNVTVGIWNKSTLKNRIFQSATKTSLFVLTFKHFMMVSLTSSITCHILFEFVRLSLKKMTNKHKNIKEKNHRNFAHAHGGPCSLCTYMCNPSHSPPTPIDVP